MAAKYGSRQGVGNYWIPKNATLPECIWYAQRYIVGSRSHYRYNKYKRALQSALLYRHPKIRQNGKMIHINIGCGPGLFSWVVRDHFRTNLFVNVESHGYDHSRNMVALARLLSKKLREDTHLSFYHDMDKLFVAVLSGESVVRNVVVTLGHVLVQTVDNEIATKDFARIIAKFAKSANCQVVAADAHSGERFDIFKRSCRNLRNALDKHGLTASMSINSGSLMFARIKQEATHE